MWNRALKNDALSEVFGIAQMYIEILSKTKKPIKYIRFNEAGDFINQKILDSAAIFAQEMKEKYGVLSMAYTANKFLDFTKEINGISIDNIIKINASRLDIKLSKNSMNNNFLATPMDFSKALINNDKVISISEDDIKNNKFECLGVLNDPNNGSPSIPVLTKGTWNGGSGWYYVCPCSFWGFNKEKATLLLLKKFGLVDKDVNYLPSRTISEIVKKLNDEQKKEIKLKTNKIKSPCGIKCAVCHNMTGGVPLELSKYDSDKWKYIKNYTVLEATHGVTSSNYNPDYANAKRIGNDDVSYSNKNKYGMITKFNQKLISLSL